MSAILIAFTSCTHTPPEIEKPFDPSIIPVDKLSLPQLSLPPHVHTSTSKYDFWFSQIKDRHSFALTLTCLIGATSEPHGKEGILNLMIETMLQATIRKSHGALMDALFGNGGQIAGHAEMHGTSISITGPSDDFSQLVPLVEEIIREPRFDPDDFKRVQDRLWSQTIYALENPARLAMVASDAHYYTQGRERIPIEGTPKSIQELTLEDVMDYHKNVRNCPRWIISATTPFSEAVTKQLLKKSLPRLVMWRSKGKSPKQIPLPTPLVAQGTSIHFVEKNEINQATILIRRPLPPRKYKDYAALLIANEILGGSFTSRLNRALRLDAHLTYGTSSDVSATKNFGNFSILTAARADRFKEAFQLILKTWREFGETGATERELQKAKNHVTGLYPFQFQDRESILNLAVFNDWVGLPYASLANLPREIENVSNEDLKRVLKAELSSNQFFALVVGPSSLKSELESLKIPMSSTRGVDYLAEWPFENRPK